MKHKCIEYQVAQTANPMGWQWTVRLDGGRIKAGVSPSREYAIYDVTNAIEKALSVTPEAN